MLLCTYGILHTCLNTQTTHSLLLKMMMYAAECTLWTRRSAGRYPPWPMTVHATNNHI